MSLNTLTRQLKLPVEFRSSKKGLSNINNNNQKCLLWCHIRHINPIMIHLERIICDKLKNC